MILEKELNAMTNDNPKHMCSECGEEEVENEGDICDDCFYANDDESDDFEEDEVEADDP
jgi:NMD protein affecting ribosome stability and mRNA decay